MTENQIQLSATIITYNEEKNIKECIESVHELCDEVLVLDSNSTDRTREIAESFERVKFLTHPFDGHIQQKNRAIDLASGRWIFSLDADERVTPELARSIKEYIEQNPDGVGARVKRLTKHLGKFIRFSGWYNTRYRLLRRGCGRWGGENPHDTILIDGHSAFRTAFSKPLKGDLLHYSFYDLSDQIDTINKFSSIVAFTRSGRGKRFSLLKLFYKPPLKFFEVYILKLGFLDGIPGFILAVCGSFAAFAKNAKLWELQHTDLERPGNIRKDYSEE